MSRPANPIGAKNRATVGEVESDPRPPRDLDIRPLQRYLLCRSIDGEEGSMRTKIQRWGHSLAIRIPKPFAIEVRLGEETEVDLTVTNGSLVVAPAAKPAPSLQDLLSRVTKRNLHGEVDTGSPVGREAW